MHFDRYLTFAILLLQPDVLRIEPPVILKIEIPVIKTLLITAKKYSNYGELNYTKTYSSTV